MIGIEMPELISAAQTLIARTRIEELEQLKREVEDIYQGDYKGYLEDRLEELSYAL